MSTIRKPYKSGGDFVRDGNGDKLLLTKSQVMKRYKAMCKRGGWLGLTRYFVNDYGDYWTTSAY